MIITVISTFGAIISIAGAIISIMNSINQYKSEIDAEFTNVGKNVKLRLKNLNKNTVIYGLKRNNGYIDIKIKSDAPDFSIYNDYCAQYLDVFDTQKIYKIVYDKRICDIKKELGAKSLNDINEIEYGNIEEYYDKSKLIVYTYPQKEHYETHNIAGNVNAIFTDSILPYKNIFPELYKKLGFDLLTNLSDCLLEAFAFMQSYNHGGKLYLINGLYESKYSKPLKELLNRLKKSDLLTNDGINYVDKTLKNADKLETLMLQYYSKGDNTEDIPVNIIIKDYITLFKYGFSTILPNELCLKIKFKNSKKIFTERIELNARIKI